MCYFYKQICEKGDKNENKKKCRSGRGCKKYKRRLMKYKYISFQMLVLNNNKKLNKF